MQAKFKVSHYRDFGSPQEGGLRSAKTVAASYQITVGSAFRARGYPAQAGNDTGMLRRLARRQSPS